MIKPDRFTVVHGWLLFEWGGVSYEAKVMSIGIPVVSEISNLMELVFYSFYSSHLAIQHKTKKQK